MMISHFAPVVERKKKKFMFYLHVVFKEAQVLKSNKTFDYYDNKGIG